MKKFFVLILLLCLSASGFAQKIKEKRVKINSYAYYEGPALKKTPLQNGALYIGKNCTASGVFNGTSVTNGMIRFDEHDFILCGDFVYELDYKNDLQITLSKENGKFNNKPILHKITISFEKNKYRLVYTYKIGTTFSTTFMDSAIEFMGESKYQESVDGIAKMEIDEVGIKESIAVKPTQTLLTFDNGGTIVYKNEQNQSVWTHPNGNVIVVNGTTSLYVADYKITIGKTTFCKGSIIHTFENGNTYKGTIKQCSFTHQTKLTRLADVLALSGINWSWDKFSEIAANGVLTYADGTSEKIINGITETEFLRIEAERKAKEEAARREAERLEAERKAKEEAARREAERLEAKRKAEEERKANILKAKLKAVRARDKVVYSADGEITSCTITYLDGTVYKYAMKNGEVVCSQYVYKNGNKMGAYFNGVLTSELYNELLADSEAPEITDFEYNASFRQFTNGYKFTNHDSYLITPKRKNGDYINYHWNSSTKQYEPSSWSLHIKGGHFVTKEGMGFFKFSSGTVYAGECSLEYDESKPCAIQSDPNIKALGVKIPCGIENVAYNDCRIDGDVFVVNDQDELLRFYSHGFSFSYDYICSIYGARRECDKMIKLCKVALLTEMLSVKYKGAQDEIGDLIVNKCISEGLPIGVIREILNKVSYYEYEEKLVGQEKKIIIKEWSNTVGVLTFNAKTGKLKTYSIHDSYEWERLFQDQRYLDYYTISSLL